MENTLTIAIPVYNRSRFIKEALESALNQTMPTKVIVADNASTAFDFEALVNSYNSPRLKYYRNPFNLGMMANWNRCIELCETPYVTVLNDDDILFPTYAENVAAHLDQQPAMVGTGTQHIDEKGAPICDLWDREKFRHFENWGLETPWISPAFSVKDALSIGGFRTKYEYIADCDLWFRLAMKGPFEIVNKMLVKYRVYHSADRCTCSLDKNFTFIPLTIVQGKRNRHAFKKARPEIQLQPLKRPGIALKTFLQSVPNLSPRMARYACGIYVRTAGGPWLSKLLRSVFRLGGRPLYTAAAGVTRLVGKLKV